MEQSIEDAADKFEGLLFRNIVENGIAYQNAKSLYEGKQKSKIIKENLPKAWQKLLSEPGESLVDLLNETLEKISGYKAENYQIIEFLHQKVPNPNLKLSDFKVQKKIIKDPVTIADKQDNALTSIRPEKHTDEIIKLDTDWLRDLSFTKIIEGTFANSSASTWRGLLNFGLKTAFDRKLELDFLRNELDVNLKEGTHNINGYASVEGTNFSLQGQDANDTANNTLKLAKLLNCELYVLFEWREKGRFPEKKGAIHWKP